MKLTKNDGNINLGCREGIRGARFWKNNEGSIDRSSEPPAVGVPPQCALLILNLETVSVGSAGHDGALCHKFRTIGPRGPHLSYTVPSATIQQLGQVHVSVLI